MPVPATSVASSYTAPSTQPPETEPLTVPSGATTIDAPGSLGADEYVRTTVPTPAVAPDRQTAAKSWSSSLTVPKVGAFRDTSTLYRLARNATAAPRSLTKRFRA